MLGPLKVSDNGHGVELGGAKERTLLAVLLLHANETVSTERLIDELWGEQPPPSAARRVSTCVWRLRKTLGDAIVTQPPGYRAVVPPERLDTVRFDALVRRSRELGSEEAAATLAEALALWRGSALEDIRFEAEAAHDVERLDDRRFAAIAMRIDHDLGLGRHESVLPELEQLVAAHPYREQFRAQLMLALYRSGQQADALAGYRDFRRRSADELGIEPGPELQRLERSILAQEPELEAPDGGTRRPPRRRRAVLLAALAAALLAAALVGIAVTRGEPAPVDVGPNAVAVVDPTGGVVAGVPVGIEPGAIVSGPDAVWAASFADRNLSRIDPATRRVVGTIPIDGSPTALAYSRGTLWAIARYDRTVTAVDLEFDAPRSTRLPIVPDADQRALRPTSVAPALGRIRIGSTDGSLLDSQGRKVAAVAFPTSDLASARDSLWVVGAHRRGIPSAETPGVIYRLDSATLDVESETAVGRQPNGIALGLGFVWVVNTDDGTLERLDPITGGIARDDPPRPAADRHRAGLRPAGSRGRRRARRRRRLRLGDRRPAGRADPLRAGVGPDHPYPARRFARRRRRRPRARLGHAQAGRRRLTAGRVVSPALLLKMKRAADPYRDTDVVDARAPRTNQAAVGFLALVSVTVGPWWLLAVLALQLALGLTLGRRWCVACVFYFEVLQPRFGEGPLEDARPPRFANLVGLVVLGAASLAYLGGADAVGAALGVLVAVLALLAAVTGFCAGCTAYRIGYRLTGRPFVACPLPPQPAR